MVGGQKAEPVKAELAIDLDRRLAALQVGEPLQALDEVARRAVAEALGKAAEVLLGLAPLGDARFVIALKPAGAAAPQAPAGDDPGGARARVLEIAQRLGGQRYRALLARRIQEMFGVAVPADRDPDPGALSAEQWAALLRYMEQAAGRRAS